MRRLAVITLGIVALLPLGMAAPVNAQLVTYTGSDVGAGSADPMPNSTAVAAAFDVAASLFGAENTIDFETAPLGAFTSLVVAPGVTMTNIGDPSLSIENTPFGSPDSLFGYNTTVAGSQFALINSGNGQVTFSFTSPIDAFGLFLTGVQLGTETIVFDDGSSQTITVPNPSSSNGGVDFVGFTDLGASISSVTFNSVNDIDGIDDVRYVNTQQAPSGTPEPGSLAMLFGMGSIGFGIAKRRRTIRRNANV